MKQADILSALDPGKQGLKRYTVRAQIDNIPTLSALDPGKQGLKRAVLDQVLKGTLAFSA